MHKIFNTLATLSALALSVGRVSGQLHQSFWGMAYTPPNSAYYPNCGDTIEEVSQDIQLIAQLTTRIRLYGTDCKQAELVQEAIKRTKSNVHVYLGIYIDGNETTYERQRDQAFQVLDQYGVDNILGITVGNEYILQQFVANETSRGTAEDYVIEKIADVRKVLATKKYKKTLPVGTADAGSQMTAKLGAAVDYGMANTHPFFSGVGIAGAAEWTAQFLVNDEPRFITAAGKTLLNAEVGWPTDAIPGGALSLNGSAATLPNIQRFLDDFVCAANKNITAKNEYGAGYFYFELMDAVWKLPYKGAEPYWGLFDADHKLKDIKIPDCKVEQMAPVNGNTNGGSSSGNTGGGKPGPSGGGSTSTGGSTSNSNSNTQNAGERLSMSAVVATGLMAVAGVGLML